MPKEETFTRNVPHYGLQPVVCGSANEEIFARKGGFCMQLHVLLGQLETWQLRERCSPKHAVNPAEYARRHARSPHIRDGTTRWRECLHVEKRGCPEERIGDWVRRRDSRRVEGGFYHGFFPAILRAFCNINLRRGSRIGLLTF